ncbi:hypothetical protein NN561_009192 [Cricetulus griseus]
MTLGPGVPAPRLSAVLGHRFGSRWLLRREGLRGQLHRVSLLPGTGIDRLGPRRRKGPQSPFLESPPGKEYTFLSEWTLVGGKRLERKALAFADRPCFSRVKWLPPRSPLPAAPRAGL